MVLKLLSKPWNKIISIVGECVNNVTLSNNYVTINGVYRLNFTR